MSFVLVGSFIIVLKMSVNPRNVNLLVEFYGSHPSTSPSSEDINMANVIKGEVRSSIGRHILTIFIPNSRMGWQLTLFAVADSRKRISPDVQIL